MTRRRVFGVCGAIAVAGSYTAGKAADTKSGDGFSLGVCTYSFREFQRNLTISLIKQLGVSYISVKDFHLSYSSTPEEIAKALNAKQGPQVVAGMGAAAVGILFHPGFDEGMSSIGCQTASRQSVEALHAAGSMDYLLVDAADAARFFPQS